MSHGRPASTHCLGALLVLLALLLTGCGGVEVHRTGPAPADGTPDAVKIFMLDAGTAQLGTVAGGAPFQVTLSQARRDLLWFSDRPAQTAGTDTLANLVGGIWPRTFASVAPNALLKGTLPSGEAFRMFCTLDRPVYDPATGQLSFQATWLNGNRPPATNLAFSDVRILVLNNEASPTEVWSQLLQGGVCTFEPTAVAGTYTFRMERIVGDVFSYTSAPRRLSMALPAPYYLGSWPERFRTSPPNVSIAYDARDNPSGGVQIATLSDPVFDPGTGAVTFTARRLFGTSPIGPAGLTVANPSVFLDPGGSDGLTVKVTNRRAEDVYLRFHGAQVDGDGLEGSIKVAKDGGEKTFTVRTLRAGRIYVSCGEALQSSFATADDLPDGANAGDNSSSASARMKALYHDFRTRFDWLELTYVPGAPSPANLTAVDAFGIPMVLETRTRDGLTISRLTLKDGTKGTDVRTALEALIDKDQDKVRPAIIKNDAGQVVRILSPLKNAAPYAAFDTYLDSLVAAGTTVNIKGTFLKAGENPQPYDFAGTFDATRISLAQAGRKTLHVPLASLKQNKGNALDTNGIYTCNASFTVDPDGGTQTVGKNDFYAAVYRDLVAGLNLGSVRPGVNGSSEGWWHPQSQVFQDPCNAYAKTLYQLYPGTYGFPFNDIRFKVLAQLGDPVVQLNLTVLKDEEAPPAASANVATWNPQPGDPGVTRTWNLSITPPQFLVQEDGKFPNYPIRFGKVDFLGNRVYNNFADRTDLTELSNGGGQICRIPAKPGWNFYNWEAFGQLGTVMVKFPESGDPTGTASGSINGTLTVIGGTPVLFMGWN